MTHVGNTQGRQVVSLAVLAAHTLALTSTVASECRGDVAPLLARTSSAGRGAGSAGSRSGGGRLVAHTGSDVGSAGGALADGGHGVLVGTAGGEMLAVTDTALDLLVLELVLHGDGVGVLGLVAGVLAPVNRGLEDDVLADRGGVRRRAGAVPARLPELGPRLPLRHPWVHHLAVLDQPDPPRRLDLLPVLVVAVLDHRRASVLVGYLLRRREVLWGLVEILIVGPVVSVVTRTWVRKTCHNFFFLFLVVWR